MLKYSLWLSILEISLGKWVLQGNFTYKDVYDSEKLEIIHMYNNKKLFSKWRKMEYYVIIKIMFREFFKNGEMLKSKKQFIKIAMQ